MFDLLTRSPRTRKPVTRSVSLCLERLEDRLSPTGGMEMLGMNVTYVQNKQVTLAGSLSSPSGPVTNQTINFGGVVKGTATTDAQGNYSVTLTASALGQVTAASADGLSNQATYTLVGGTPVINNFTAIPEGGGLWEFSGNVTGAPAQGEVVNFGGIPALENQSRNVQPDGTFSFFVVVASGQGGVATAQAVDWWGDTSKVAMTGVLA